MRSSLLDRRRPLDPLANPIAELMFIPENGAGGVGPRRRLAMMP